jgi:hypothetical protein
MIAQIGELFGDTKFSIAQCNQGKNEGVLISNVAVASVKLLSSIANLKPFTTGTVDLDKQTIKIIFHNRKQKRKRQSEWTKLPISYKTVKNNKSKNIILSLINSDEDMCIMKIEENDIEKIVLIRNLEPISLQSAINIGPMATDVQFNFKLKCLVFRI